MKHRNSTIKKILSAVLIGAFAATPFIITMPIAQADRPGWMQSRNDRGRDWGRDRDRKGYETFAGRVTHIDSDRRFDIRVGFRTYNVTLASRLPRRLSRGDMVRVQGRRSGVNDIDNARVEVLGSNTGDYGNRYETFVGTVTNIEHSRRFDININGKIYNVNAGSRVSYRLNRGDEVRVTGQRSGVNDIDNARVEILRNRSGSRGYEVFTGIVTKIEHSKRFDIRANGKIYNVNTTDSLSRGMRVGDDVRVYGRRSGVNDIDYARVEVLRRR